MGFSRKNKRAIKVIFMVLSLAIILTLVIGFTGCKAKVEEKPEQEIEVSKEEKVTEKETKEELKLKPEEEVAEAEEIPQYIQDLIDSADSYYNEGEYALAQKKYREAIIAVDNSSLSTSKKQELKDKINPKYEDTKNIVDTARMHYGNAMQLQYEKRFEEAKEELEAALEIYPKYQDAIDALSNLEAIMGLNQ